MTLRFLLSVFLCFFLSCNKFEFNPYQTDNKDIPTNLNAKNIAELLSTESSSDDTVTILFTGDSQRYYDRLDDLIKVANRYPSIDFMLLDGDISDFGLMQEFLWIHERLEKLNFPYICTIGNHDLTSAGSEIYSQLFGPKNFTFNYKHYKFLCYNDNGREYNFPGNIPDLNWMARELNDTTASWFVGAAHVPPWCNDFDQHILQSYLDLMSSSRGFILSLHGHLVDPSERYYNNDHVLYINSSGVQQKECYILKLIHGTILKEKISY